MPTFGDWRAFSLLLAWRMGFRLVLSNGALLCGCADRVGRAGSRGRNVFSVFAFKCFEARRVAVRPLRLVVAFRAARTLVVPGAAELASPAAAFGCCGYGCD